MPTSASAPDIIRRLREIIDNAPTTIISFYKAAQKNSVSDRNALNCNCKKGCTTNRCNCRKRGKECGQNCHGDECDCGNMAERIADRIDKPIIINSDVEPSSASTSASTPLPSLRANEQLLSQAPSSHASSSRQRANRDRLPPPFPSMPLSPPPIPMKNLHAGENPHKRQGITAYNNKRLGTSGKGKIKRRSKSKRKIS